MSPAVGKKKAVATKPRAKKRRKSSVKSSVADWPPSKIREAARLAFAERLVVLTDIADSADARPADRIAAMKVLADTRARPSRDG